jgi:hypothetical protein
MTTTEIKRDLIKKMGRLGQLRELAYVGDNATIDEKAAYNIELLGWFAELNKLYELCVAEERVKLAEQALAQAQSDLELIKQNLSEPLKDSPDSTFELN